MGNAFWLLEQLSKSKNRQVYFGGFTDSGLSTTFNHDRALKFESKEEAEKFASRNGLVDWDALEHMWG